MPGLAQPRALPERLRVIGAPRPFALREVTDADRPAPKKNLPMIGMQRTLPARALSAPNISRSSDGRTILSAAVSSPGAVRIRVHFRNFDAGAGEVWVYGQGNSVGVGPYTGRGMFGTGEFWSAAVDGSTAVISYVAPAGSSPMTLPFTADSISHQWTVPTPSAGPSAAVATCSIDVCQYPAYETLSKAVVQYDFISDGQGYVCSGGMVATRAGSGKAYMMTANHCIGGESEARSIEARFFYQRSSCTDPVPDYTAVPTMLGGSLLASGAIETGDYSLVLLNSVPIGTTFLNWSTTLDTRASVVGIHHPGGSYKRIAFGTRGDDRDINLEGDNGEILTGPKDFYYRVNWTSGVTQGGSSGSPLLDQAGNLVGTLTAGPAVSDPQQLCSINAFGAYGRFSAAYAAVSPYLEDLPAGFSATPTTLAFQVTDGVVSPQQSVAVTTSSASALTLAVTSNKPWLKVSGGGLLSASSPATVNVSVDAATLTTAGVFNGLVTLDAGTGGSMYILATVTVGASRSNVSLSVSPNPVYKEWLLGFWYWYYTINLQETAGAAIRVDKVTTSAYVYEGNEVAEVFGGRTLQGPGSLSGYEMEFDVSPPATKTITVEGVDVATGRSWQATKNVVFLGEQPAVSVTNTPASITRNPNSSAACPWVQTLVVRETAGIPVQLTGLTVGSRDLTAAMAKAFGAIRLPGNGAFTGSFCWQSSETTTDVKQTVLLKYRDDYGTVFSATGSVTFLEALSGGSTLSVSPASIALSSGQMSSQFSVSVSGGSGIWLRTQPLGPYDTSWLTLTEPSANVIRATANADGLANGYYSATILVYSAQLYPNAIPLTVSLRVGPAPATPSISAGGVVNAWSSSRGIAPGSLISIYGENLATGAVAAPAVPFSNQMADAVVTINGIQAPLSYVSPGQLNVQVPFEIEPGAAQVVVTVNGQASNAETVQVTAVAPSICPDWGTGKLCYDPSGKVGDYKLAFVTGQGALSPTVPTGGAPATGTAVENLPRPAQQPVRVTIGGIEVEPLFAGIPDWSVGVMQVNFQVPAGLAPGDHPLVVTVGGTPSQTAYFTVTQ